MVNGFKVKLGDWVEVSTNERGHLSDLSWGKGSKTHKGQVVGFDPAGHPLLYIAGVDARLGTWDVETEAGKNLVGIDPAYFSQIPVKTPCLFLIFEPTSIRPLTSNTNTDVKMKHNLKVGDRIVLAVNSGQSQPAAYAWTASAAGLPATVMGQDPRGNPVLQFDSNPGYGFMYSWDYNWGSDVSMVDPSMRAKFSIHDKRSWIMEKDTTAFVSEADWKAGKRPVASGMPFETMCSAHSINSNGDVRALDAKEFMRHLGNSLPDEQESFLYGEQFASLLNKQAPHKHEVFIKDKRSVTTYLQAVRGLFSDAHIINNGVIDSSNPDLIVEEFLVKWRHSDTVNKNFKVHIASPVNANVKSPFEKGGADVMAFQMFRKDLLVKNFASKDFNAVVAEVLKKEFNTFGQANKALIDELIKKGFSSKGKIKESNKTMSTTNSFAQMMKEDFHKATYRVAADQITHGIKEGIVALITSKGGSQSQLEGMKMLLDSEIGEAAIAMLAGLGLTYAPMVSADPRAQRLAGEFRVNGMAKAGNVLVETMIGSFLPIVQGALASLPAEEQVRVETAAPARIGAPTEEQEEEETTTAEPKKAVA